MCDCVNPMCQYGYHTKEIQCRKRKCKSIKCPFSHVVRDYINEFGDNFPEDIHFIVSSRPITPAGVISGTLKKQDTLNGHISSLKGINLSKCSYQTPSKRTFLPGIIDANEQTILCDADSDLNDIN